jgi:hypothetical protein
MKWLQNHRKEKKDVAMIEVDGRPIKDPSGFEWGLQDVSAADAGRTDDMLMHKNRLGQKRKIKLSWNNPTPEEAASILQAFNPEYVFVTYPDSMSGTDETREFTVGDRSAQMRSWAANYKRYTQVVFNIIER